MDFIKKNWKGMLACLCIAVPSWLLGKKFPIIGGPVIAIIAGMVITLMIKDKSALESGIKYTSKKILQYAVVLLGFGLNLEVIFKTGRQSLPIIISTITTSLVIAYVLHRVMHIPGKILFPTLGAFLEFSQNSGEAFGIFAGTAINDTSSVTAAASTWDSMYALGNATLDKAVTVKLTRTLAIIPITLALAVFRTYKAEEEGGGQVSIKQVFPFFILFFIGASIITTIAAAVGVPMEVFAPLKELSKFFIIMAMAAIGLHTNIIKLVKTGGKPILMGMAGITLVSLGMQHVLNIW